MLKEEILLLCKNFVKAADSLYKSGQITHEKYMEMIKLKQEYIDNIEKSK